MTQATHASPLAFHTRGEGENTLFALHGFLGSGRNLASLARHVADNNPSWRVVMPDLRGHGSSPPLSAQASLQDLAQDIFDLAAHLGVKEPLHILGHSMGGRVALTMCLMAGERVADVTLLDISPSGLDVIDASGPQAVLPVLLSAPDACPDRQTCRSHFENHQLSAALTDWLLQNVERRDGQLVWRIDRRALAAFHARTRGTDLWAALEVVGIEFHCVRGGASRFVSDADAARLRAKGCSVDTLAGAGHFVHVDALAELLRVLAAHKVPHKGDERN